MLRLRAAASMVILFVLFFASGSSAATPNPPSGMPDARDDPPSVLHEDERTFFVSRRSSPSVRVTFLSARSFRLRLFPDSDPIDRLPEYMGVRSDASFPPVAVHMSQHGNAITFGSADVTLDLAIEDDVVSVEVRTSSAKLIERWRIGTGRRTSRLGLRPGEHIYGFGDKRAALDQRGQRLEMVNRDAFASETNDSYKSIPFYLSSAGYGLFFHNFHPSVFDIGASDPGTLTLAASGGAMDFYVFVGDPKQVISQYTELTGRPALLPRWAFGYHQGKASYKGRDAFTVADEMRRRGLPIDVVYYDDWSDEATSKPFIDSLWERYHVKLTLGFGMPMFGRFRGTDDSTLLRDLAARGYLMVDRDKRPVIGPNEYVDPGDQSSSVAYLDYFSPHAVDYMFSTHWERALSSGAILGMVDFGEMDHVTDAENKYWPSVGLSVAKTRNLFGLVYPLSVVDGVVKRTGRRSTGMVRPGFAGTQRLGWATTGDSIPTYRNFRAHTRALLNLTLSGFSNVGQDIGGWDSKGPDTLYARWFAAGTFFPFMWSHGQGDHEPYAHGAAVEDAARHFLNLRYRLVPLLYSLHHAAHVTGVPVLRSLPLQEPAEPAAARIDDQFFIGDNLLVAPIFNDEGDRSIYLPKGLWYDFFGERPAIEGGGEVVRRAVPLDRIPVYVRAGAVIPLGPAMQYTGEKPVDPLDVHVYGFGTSELAGGPRSSAFALYEDDGQGKEYLRGRFQQTSFRLEQDLRSTRLQVHRTSGNGRYWSVAERGYRLHFHGFEGRVTGVRVDGEEIARADSKASAAAWSIDATSGDVLISIAPASKRDFTVEFTTAGPGLSP